MFTAISFFSIGLVKGKVVNKSPVRSGLNTLMIGGIAAVVSFFSWKFARCIRKITKKYLPLHTNKIEPQNCNVSSMNPTRPYQQMVKNMSE